MDIVGLTLCRTNHERSDGVIITAISCICVTSSLTNQIADVKAVEAEKTALLLCGLVDDVDVAVDEFIAALQTAGIQDIVDLAQEQINAQYGK